MRKQKLGFNGQVRQSDFRVSLPRLLPKAAWSAFEIAFSSCTDSVRASLFGSDHTTDAVLAPVGMRARGPVGKKR